MSQSSQRWIDLHLHSTASDGAYSPAYLMQLAHVRGLSAVALTDHDTVAGVEEASVAASGLGLEFVPGIELEASYGRGNLHLLGYFIDPHSPSLTQCLAAVVEQRIERNKKIIERLAHLGFALDYTDLVRRAGGENIGRPHIADALVNRGMVSSHHEAFNKYLGEGCAAWAPRENLSTADAIAVIREAGGIASLAHPGLIAADSHLELRTLIRKLVDAGLQAIEVYHPDHSTMQSKFFEETAKKLQLSITGGSDFHRLGTRCSTGIGFGGVRVGYDILDNLRRSCAMLPHLTANR